MSLMGELIRRGEGGDRWGEMIHGGDSGSWRYFLSRGQSGVNTSYPLPTTLLPRTSNPVVTHSASPDRNPEGG
jgi:hypothetical protein